ncbi:MAG: HlyD family type I secretion periplasmic adaptor subunit [Magnetococcales bacterium]|nr:HlyD family type I secretion periplasmic adaptor subunit [Magnetococcales bacterium]
MIDTKLTDKKELLKKGDAKAQKAEIPAAKSSGKEKKSGLRINLGQKKPAKKSEKKPEVKPEKKKVEESRLNLEKKAVKKPLAEQGKTPKKKKKGGGLSITSKVRPKAKPEKKELKKPPIPPVVSKSDIAKKSSKALEEVAEKAKVPPLAAKNNQGEKTAATDKKAASKSKVPPLAAKNSEVKPPASSAENDTGKAKIPPLATDPAKAPANKAGTGKQGKPSEPKALGQIPLEKMAASEVAAKAKKPPPAAAKPTPPPPKEAGGNKADKGDKAKSPILSSSEEPESLLSLLEPDPEEVTKLKQGPKQDRFLSQSVVLEESGLGTLVRSSILLVAFLIALFLTWASFTTIDEMASTTGTVIPNSPVQVIQHLEGGIVEEIFVSEGQIISEGGKLARLSPESAEADLNQMRVRLASLMAQKIRIVAMLEDKRADFSEIPEEYDTIIKGQASLLSAQRSAYTSQIDTFNTRIDRSKASLENLLAQQEALQLQINYSNQEMEVKNIGFKKGLMSRLMVIAAKRDKIRVESELVRVIGSTVGARKDLHEALNELDGFLDKSREENFRELGVITAELSQVKEGMSRLDDRVKRLVIYSPVWGIVKDLKISTVGGVVGPGSPLTEIVPLDETRRVETMINTKDIGHVKIGQGVTVKVSTYDFARYGGIQGVLESISPTTFDDPTGGEPFYKGIVRLQKSYIGNEKNTNQILPGMVVQADIHIGAKTLMEYLLKPIYASVNKAFQER